MRDSKTVITPTSHLRPRASSLVDKPRESARHRFGWFIVPGLLLLLACLCVLSVMLGAKSIGISTVWLSVTGQLHSSDSVIILDSRVPRTLMGLAVGSALGVAGSLIQTLSRNPLADPGILGVNSGASFAVVLGIALLGNQTMTEHLGLAFLGALVTSLLVYVIGTYRETGASPMKITLSGVAVGALLTGIASTVTLTHPGVFDQVRFWDAGSLDVRSFSLLKAGVGPIVIGLVIALAIAPSLDNLALGEDLARGLGTRVVVIQALTLLAIALLCGTATAMAGPIGFVGLMIPHIARSLAGPNQGRLTLYAILLGPSLLIAADIIGRLISDREIRVSIVIAFVGAPMLIMLARKVNHFGQL